MRNFFFIINIILIGYSINPAILFSSQFSPSIYVNDEVITKYDVNQRRKLLIALGTESKKALNIAKETLINETLQKTLANELGVSVNSEERQQIFSNFASSRGMSNNQLASELKSLGSSSGQLKSYLSASLLMRNLVQRKFGTNLSINDLDINAIRPKSAMKIPPQVLLSEIVIPYAIRGKENTLILAKRLYNEIKNGQDFASTARRFSQSKSAAAGGRIGYIPLAGIPSDIRSTIKKLKKNDITQPIKTPDAVIIFKLNARKTIQKPKNRLFEIVYAVFLEKAKKGDDCKNFNKEELLGPMNMAKVPKKYLTVLSRLEPQNGSVFINSDGMKEYIVLCERRALLEKKQLEALRRQLLEQKLANLAEGMMLDLKRTSLIEVLN